MISMFNARSDDSGNVKEPKPQKGYKSFFSLNMRMNLEKNVNIESKVPSNQEFKQEALKVDAVNQRLKEEFEFEEITYDNYCQIIYCHSSQSLSRLLLESRHKLKETQVLYMSEEDQIEFITSFERQRGEIEKEWKDKSEELHLENNYFMLFVQEYSIPGGGWYEGDYADVEWSIYLCGMNLMNPKLIHVYGPISLFWNQYY